MLPIAANTLPGTLLVVASAEAAMLMVSPEPDPHG